MPIGTAFAVHVQFTLCSATMGSQPDYAVLQQHARQQRYIM